MNSANIMDKVSVTPRPNRRNGSRINQIKGYRSNNKIAIGQHNTKRMAQSTKPINVFIPERLALVW
ncbi:hypothetical protein SAMN04488057_12248 [Cyclobacterium lianum]|uniref:Uncharacterized protein n=1 Tax=Cyclobacterium lianum TaxID=388280 RepID=A0A1M7QRA3_9BACT|nr:hypothetical protein [Cyclobacterium lianum]SHN34133.1 hypothetical protein SAMN04488057_12248 [Cyclobacterium lianum]